MTFEREWEEAVAGLRPVMDAMHQTREGALRECRLLIQTSSKCIRHVHRRQFTEAQGLLAEAQAVADRARGLLAPHPELYFTGFLQDAEKEMVEAAVLLAMVKGNTLPLAEALQVGPASYLNGVAEAASECRRYVLDDLRKGHLAEAERLLRLMETVYDDLIAFDYPDALTGGLRRTCDALRAVIERTRSDVTMTVVQRGLMDELTRAKDRSVVL